MHLSALASSVCLLSTLSIAQDQGGDPRRKDEGPFPRPALEWELREWCAEHGPSWRVWRDESTGRAELLFGGSARAPFAPREDAEWIALALEFVRSTHELHGVDVDTLVAGDVHFLPLALAGTTDKVAVGLRQELGGLSVEGGTLDVLFALDGSLLALQSRAIPAVGELDLVPRLAASDAAALATQRFFERTGLAPTSASEPILFVAQVLEEGVRRPRLAWKTDLYWREPDFATQGWSFHLDARDGALLAALPLVHELDVGGTVSTRATPGTSPDTAGNPPTTQPMPRARVTSSAGTVFTDQAGNFNFAGVSGPLAVTVEYVGQFNDVRNQAGSDYTLTVQASTGSGNQILMNPSPTELVTAQANAYVHVVKLREWIRSIDPSDAHADFTAISNVNINSTCNAFYDGGSVNFYRVGGGCVNTAYSTVVAHEMGHWLNDRYNTFNGGDGMGEGNADVFAMYLYDDPIVGKDFCGSGCHIRDGNNTRQYCGDGNGGCYGEVHADGEVWMGAAWKIRRNLNTAVGNAAGDLAANTLFLAWMNGYDQTQIHSIIEVQWLTLDDDNGNIDDGTPHYASIDSAFREQGFPGYDLPLVVFSDVTDLPDTQNESGPYVVDATITAGVNPPIQSATLRYRVNGSAFADVAMSNVSGNLWRGSIPGQQSPAEVDYYLRALDSQGNAGTFPSNAPSTLLDFDVGVLTTFFFNEFEGGTDEGWAAGDTGDNATTGVWVRVDPRGTGAQSEDDHTVSPGVRCWVTGQGSAGGGVGENDVDNGTTTLKSPVFDASGLGSPKIRYWRWYSNNAGANPGTDTFRIDLSNNGGSSWSNVEIVGPTGAQASGGWYEHELRISDFIAPTATMRMRFVASDLGGGSIVEAALDDIRGTDLGPSGDDCNGNGVDDSEDISNGTSEDCNGNGVPDECEPDCDGDGLPDACEEDCNGNGTPDDCESLADCNANGTPDVCESFADCNGNGVPDECEADCDGDGLPDACEEDCDGNGTPDDCDSFGDCNGNGIPDECEADCDGDGLPDDCEVDCNANGTPDDCESFADCNGNSVPDECEPDCDGDGQPDACEEDCNGNGTPDDCESLADCNANGTPDVCESFADCNGNSVPDECEPDCDLDGTPDDCEEDCNANGTPDDCESLADCNANGTPDVCESFADCNGNAVPDECDIAFGTSEDLNGNGVPDECECIAASYCQTAMNSVGPGALISHTGSLSVSLNDTVLLATGLPPSQFGIFHYGPNQLEVPFGNGFRCVGGQVFRLPTQLSDGSGTMSRALDVNDMPNGGEIEANDTWNFQCWYRDPMGGGAAFNLSDGLQIRFCE